MLERLKLKLGLFLSTQIGSMTTLREPRKALAARFIRGSGIEIGALHNPLWLPSGVRVNYVDRFDEEGLRGHYPELNALPLVKVDIIDDGEKLATLKTGSLDFIIANHFIEHTQDPIGTVKRHLEVLRPGGILYMAVPDKRFTFDRGRQETDFAHVLRDYTEGPEWSYENHLREFAALVMGRTGEALEETVSGLKHTNYSIHFHVWSEDTFRDFLTRLITDIALPFKIEAFVATPSKGGENICILRKIA